ncbi:ATP-binding cassette, sub-family E, member 1 [Nematocida sp. AWRm80]|nr:ATP-binding cassette, sub-family E, member 1 [Nematocida sp. AWRm80]
MKEKEKSQLTRLAVVLSDRCKPKLCQLECKRSCPVNRQGKPCITVEKTSKNASISEVLCIGCSACQKKCPFEAIKIINLPTNLAKEVTHRYSENGFKLHRLPVPRPEKVLGLIGTNGIGKSTALDILSGKLKPNLGNFNNPPDWQTILTRFRGSELQKYLQRLINNEIRISHKTQHIDRLPAQLPPTTLLKTLLESTPAELDELLNNSPTVQLEAKETKNTKTAAKESNKETPEETKEREERIKYLYKELELEKLKDRKVSDLSGGELQRLSIAMAILKPADLYIFDEPSSYLDVKQRVKAAQLIRELLSSRVYVIVVEHDLSILDLISDLGCVLYGTPGAYGVISHPFSIREAINIFLNGMLPTENMRFRSEGLTFRISSNTDNTTPSNEKRKNTSSRDSISDIEDISDTQINHTDLPGIPKDKDQKKIEVNDVAQEISELEIKSSLGSISYPILTKSWENSLNLTADKGTFSAPEIIVLLGENGMGKTTFIKMLGGEIPTDNKKETPKLTISTKPQKISPKYPNTVRTLFLTKAKHALVDSLFNIEVMNPLNIPNLFEKKVKELSGGELQRVAIALSLAKPADLYLIDEPSAYLDSDQRIIVAKAIKRFITTQRKSAFIVEHDMIMATYLADRVIVFEGTPGIQSHATAPQNLVSGMNAFLKSLNITFRRDSENFRPRINTPNSAKDREQRETGNYFSNEA